MGLVQSFCNARDSFGSWIRSRVAGMKIVQLDTEGFTSFQIVKKGIISLFCLVRVLLRKVDKI